MSSDRDRNLYDETMSKFELYGKTMDDISWIGSLPKQFGVHHDTPYRLDVDEFFAAAKNTDYYSGYGTCEIPVDLVIVFKDGSHLERYEYDGSEGWEYKLGLEPPKTYAPLKSDTLKVEFGEDGLRQAVDEDAARPWGESPSIVAEMISGYEDMSEYQYEKYDEYMKYMNYGE